MSNIEKTFTDGVQPISVLHDFSFEALEGEFVSVIGPIGSGKSTILNIIAGLESINQGKIVVNHVDMTVLGEEEKGEFRKHNIGMTMQYHMLFPTLSCLDNIALPQILVGVTEDEAYSRAKDMLQQLNILSLKCCHPEHLKQHEKQLVAFASATVLKPKVVLIDEFTLQGGQDYLVYSILMELKKKHGSTIVMATNKKDWIRQSDRELNITPFYN